MFETLKIKNSNIFPIIALFDLSNEVIKSNLKKTTYQKHSRENVKKTFTNYFFKICNGEGFK